MSAEQPAWVSVETFAKHIGVGRSTAYLLVRDDPEVKRVTRRFGSRVMVCLAAWQEIERRMGEGA